jgi:AmmeMemoRadiSam system protein B
MSHTRQPAVAGRFYEADPSQCANDAAHYCRFSEALPEGAVATSTPPLPENAYGAIVPHAGWVCSGRVAGLTYAALKPRTPATTFIITGSVHTVNMNRPTLDPHDAWQTPLGDVSIDTALRDALAELPDFTTDAAAHTNEHSLEVQLPLMQHMFGDALRFVPLLIPPHPNAPRWGAAIGELLKNWAEPVAVIASTDFTHYGPNYSFNPGGYGETGYRWAHENDRRLLDIIERLDIDAVVPEANQRHNACGSGAIAATLAACQQLGATTGHTIEHTDSTRELSPLGYGDANNSVGYASVLIA